MARRNKFDPMLPGLGRFTKRIGKKVTRHPVNLEVRSLERGEAKTAAYLSEYENPTEYLITLSPRLLKGCREKHPTACPREMKKIIAHEVAHIKHPNHGEKFQVVCDELGGGERCTARGAKDLKPQQKKGRLIRKVD